MDYKRIQIIFIITFTLLNLYLLSVLLEKDNAYLTVNGESAALNLQEGMRNENINAPELSNESVQIPFIKTDKGNYLAENVSRLSNQTARMEGSKLISVLSEPIILDMQNDIPLVGRLEPLMTYIEEGNILKGEEYSFLSYHVMSDRIIFTQKVADVPIADGTGSLIFQINDAGEVLSYEQTYAGEAEVQGRERRVISEQSAIETLYLNNQIPNNSTIRNVTLSYFQTLSLSDMNIYSPMWYVEILRENVPVQVKRVDALNGNFITTPAVVEPDNAGSLESSSEAMGADIPEAEAVLMLFGKPREAGSPSDAIPLDGAAPHSSELE